MPALLSNRYLLVNENISLKFSLLSKTTTYFYPNVLQHRYHKETAFPPQILSPTLFSFNDRRTPSQLFTITATNAKFYQSSQNGCGCAVFFSNCQYTKDEDTHTASFFPANIMAQDCASLRPDMWHSENCYAPRALLQNRNNSHRSAGIFPPLNMWGNNGQPVSEGNKHD